MNKRFQWLLHAGLVFLATNLADAFRYYRLEASGGHLFREDGSVVTLADRLWQHNVSQGAGLMILLGTGMMEIVCHYGFRRGNLLTLAVCSVATGVLLAGSLGLFNAWNYGWQQSFSPEIAVAVAGYAFLYSLLRDYFRRLFREREEKTRRTQAELAALRAQVDPHFLFNTLNTIYGTALEEKASRTADHIEQLAGILRHTLVQEPDVSVAAERAFLEEYLSLQKKRLPATVTLETDWQTGPGHVRIAPLLLIPFIENAFRYGVSAEAPSVISLRLEVRDKELSFRVFNSLPRGKAVSGGQGTGIRNTRRRLELLYPGRHRLQTGEAPGGFLVTLFIQL